MSTKRTKSNPLAERNDLAAKLEAASQQEAELGARIATLTAESTRADRTLADAYIAAADGSEDGETLIAEAKRRRESIAEERTDAEARHRAAQRVHAATRKQLDRLYLRHPAVFAAEAAPIVEAAEKAREKALAAVREFAQAQKAAADAWLPLSRVGIGTVKGSQLTAAFARIKEAPTLPENLADGVERDLTNLDLAVWFRGLIEGREVILPTDSEQSQQVIAKRYADWRLVRGNLVIPEGSEPPLKVGERETLDAKPRPVRRKGERPRNGVLRVA
jgi:hypothetical protein